MGSRGLPFGYGTSSKLNGIRVVNYGSSKLNGNGFLLIGTSWEATPPYWNE